MTTKVWLKDNIGVQHDEIPTLLNASEYNAVWVWCCACAIGFGHAPLE